MTSYPNTGDRPEGIGKTAEDVRRTGSTQDVTSAEELVPPSRSDKIGGAYAEAEPAGVGAFEASTSASYAGSATERPVGGSAGSDSKRDVAKSEAADVKDTALEAGSNVAGTAKQEAGNVVREASNQARSLLE